MLIFIQKAEEKKAGKVTLSAVRVFAATATATGRFRLDKPEPKSLLFDVSEIGRRFAIEHHLRSTRSILNNQPQRTTWNTLLLCLSHRTLLKIASIRSSEMRCVEGQSSPFSSAV